MKPNTKFVIRIHFNDLNWRPTIPRLTQEWITHRMEIFMNYTCKSLRTQTNQDFETIILYDPLSEELIVKALDQYPPLPPNMHFMPKRAGLNYTKEILDSYDHVCFTKLDSDNMYHQSYMQFLHDYMPKDESTFLAFSKGYVYNASTGDLAVYTAYHEYFYTRLLTTTDFKNGIFPPVPIGGSEIAKHTAYELIEVPMFTIVCHGSNVTNTYKLVHPSRIIADQQKVSEIWKSFTGETQPYILKN